MPTSQEPPALLGNRSTLRPATYADAACFLQILDQPDVSFWWGNFDIDRVNRELVLPWDGSATFAIESERDGEAQVTGLIQFWEEEDPEYRHAGMDVAVHPQWQGKGFGSDAVRTVAQYLFEERGHHRLVIDPATGNERAIRSYEKVGFRRIGVMRRYERSDDGSWHDCLLMDMLPEDLRKA